MTLPGYHFHRLGTIMSPDPYDPREFWGAFNPTVGRTPDGRWHLLARVTAEGNVSRVRMVELVLDGDVPVGVRRGAVVLEPDEPWERGGGRGGIEDPRVTWIESLGLHVMAYTAHGGAYGARAALAVSADLRAWRRLGPVHFAYDPGLHHDLNVFPNKDVALFPEPVRAPDGRLSFAVLHRPMWDPAMDLPTGVTDARHAIWVSFASVDAVTTDLATLTLLGQHRQVAVPRFPFESMKIGAGPPPIRVPEGWLLVHHGVSAHHTGGAVPRLDYAAGAMILDAEDVSRVLFRTCEPVLAPETVEERAGVDRHIVFPSGLACIGEQRFLFYGVSDRYIGVARLEEGDDSVWQQA